jgi:hypothetical protein
MAYEDNFKVWGPYKRQSDGRQIVIVVERNGKKRTISYPKWLLECQLGRKLDKDLETAHHINGDVDDNSLDNLELIPRNEHSFNDTRRVKKVKLNCAWCDKEFERSPRLVRDKSKKSKAGPFCSRVCAGKYSRRLQLKLIDKFDVQPMVGSEYYTIRDKKASVYIDVLDIFMDYCCDILEN